MSNLNKNTFPSFADNIARDHQNVVEIMAKLDQMVTSNEPYITINYKAPDGKNVSISAITVGHVYAELTRMSQDMKLLAGLEGGSAVIQTAENKFRRIITADINVEPNDITALSPVNTFKADRNWFFDAMMNPTLNVELDLTGKVQDSCRKITSRRFIVKFEQDSTGKYTSNGLRAKDEFNANYKGQSNIVLEEFVKWMTTHPGIVGASTGDYIVDEQTFDLMPNRLRYNGSFTVNGIEDDTANGKLWYKLDSLNYKDIASVDAAPVSRVLKVGDKVSVIPNIADTVSTTVYRIIEISTATSEYRVRFEREQGQEPIPVRNAALQVYSPITHDKRVKISIGFDEYNVIFIKAINASTHILAKNWSSGIGFYSNDLRLNNTTGTKLDEYYVQKVYDYGAILQELVAKKIPAQLGQTPNVPDLLAENFQVVQINKHLTDSEDAENIRNLHNRKNTLKSEINQLTEAISKANRTVQTKAFNSDADRKRAEAELKNLTERFRSKKELETTLINAIMSAKKSLVKISPKFRVRGFWKIPNAIITGNTLPQETIQFEYQYRYSSKSGSQSSVVTYPVGDNASDKKDNAAFSNWIPAKTDVRKRVYSETEQAWIWQIEDLENADTPNINQLDLPISPGEVVEFKIRSVSEVGWPDAPLVSDWSNVITIQFPESFDGILGDDDNILKEASQEEQRVRFEAELSAKGLDEHLKTSIKTMDMYFAHSADSIASGYLDQNGKMLSLKDVLEKFRIALNIDFKA
jgi:hypothetical protein